MEANELRIGNYVKIDDLPIEKITLETFKILSEYPHHIGLFEPIPLTEEILLKCGFEKFEGEFHLNVNEVRIEMFYHDSWYFGYNRIVENNVIETCELLGYWDLHQLQNLYFALTQTELTINL